MEAEPEIASKVAAALARIGAPGLLSAYLFGSHAEGRAHRESDVDVGLLLDPLIHPSPDARFEAQLRISAGLQAELGTRSLDLVVLNDVPPGLARHVVTRGRRVACADPSRDQAFACDVQLRAADLAPFLRRMRRLKLAALAR